MISFAARNMKMFYLQKFPVKDKTSLALPFAFEPEKTQMQTQTQANLRVNTVAQTQDQETQTQAPSTLPGLRLVPEGGGCDFCVTAEGSGVGAVGPKTE